MILLAAALAAAQPAAQTAAPAAHAQHGEHQHGQQQHGQQGHDGHKGCCDQNQAGHKMHCCKAMADAGKTKACCKEHGKDKAAHQH